MEFKNLTDEQKAKAVNLQTAQEVLEFVKQEGIELSDAQLETISGGDWDPRAECQESFDPDYR